MSETERQVQNKGVCFICGDAIPVADVADFHLSSSSSCCADNSVSCVVCLQSYLENLISGGFRGYCPPIKCPAPHKKEDQHLIPFDKWKFYVKSELVNGYYQMAASTLEILCGNCHNSGTTLVAFTKRAANEALESLSQYFEPESEYNVPSLLGDLSTHDVGLITSDELYTRLMLTFPMLSSCEDESAWRLMEKVLTLIENPERRASIQLRHYKSRPRVKTSCCGFSHCWSCKTRVHEGTCKQFSSKLDNYIVPCPQCGVSLTKGDGCNTVDCFCGFSFNWASQKKRVKDSASFLEAYPKDTTSACIKIITESTDSSDLKLACAWKNIHSIDVNKGLLQWWMKTYPHCPAQAAAVPDCDVSKFIGRKEARDLFKQSNKRAVQKCISEDEAIMKTIFVSMFPNEDERLHMAWRLTSLNSCSTFKSIPLLEKSARQWLYKSPHYKKRAKSRFYENEIKSVLYLYGKTEPTKFTDVVVQYESSESSFMVESSCARLEFSNHNKSVKRPGGASCYPAAFVPVSRPESRIVFEVSNCDYTVNCMSFGLCTLNFPSTSSDGFGRTRDSWGISDSRATPMSSEYEEAWVGANRHKDASMRKLREGDRVTLSVSIEENFFEVALNDNEFRYRWEINIKDFMKLRFGCTIANNHCVTIVEDSAYSPPTPCSWISKEHVIMIQKAIRHMNDLHNSKLILSEYYKKLASSFEAESGMSKEDIVDFYMQVAGIINERPFELTTLKNDVLLPFGLNLEAFCGLICWTKCNKCLIEKSMGEKLALHHLLVNGDDSPFVAASIHHEQHKQGKSSEYKAAIAYMHVFSNDMDEWYIYNSQLEDPIVPRHSPRCRCLPRCYKECIRPVVQR